jgi:hypothetical protein
MEDNFGVALTGAIIVDALDIMATPVFIASFGILLVLGEPILFALDVLVAVWIWLFVSRNLLTFPIFVAEAIPLLQVVPFWTIFLIMHRMKKTS